MQSKKRSHPSNTTNVEEIESSKSSGGDAELGNEKDEETTLSSTNSRRKEATTKRRNRQEQQAKKMRIMRDHSSEKLIAKVGSIVTVKSDQREVSHGKGIPGIAAEVSSSGAGGAVIVTEAGVISQGVAKTKYFVPLDRYVVKSDDVILSSRLNKIRQEILAGREDYKKMPQQSIAKIHKMLYKYTKYRKGCTCKTSCCGLCGCVWSSVGCMKKCSCSGKCTNVCNSVASSN